MRKFKLKNKSLSWIIILILTYLVGNLRGNFDTPGVFWSRLLLYPKELDLLMLKNKKKVYISYIFMWIMHLKFWLFYPLILARIFFGNWWLWHSQLCLLSDSAAQPHSLLSRSPRWGLADLTGWRLVWPAAKRKGVGIRK